MDFKALKWQIIRGSLARRLILRAFLFVLAMAIIPYFQIVHDFRTMEPLAMKFDECPLSIGSNPYINFTGFLKPVSAFKFPFLGSLFFTPCKETENLTINMFKELMEKNLLDSSGKALCVGEGSASASSHCENWDSPVPLVYVYTPFSRF